MVFEIAALFRIQYGCSGTFTRETSSRIDDQIDISKLSFLCPLANCYKKIKTLLILAVLFSLFYFFKLCVEEDIIAGRCSVI